MKKLFRHRPSGVTDSETPDVTEAQFRRGSTSRSARKAHGLFSRHITLKALGITLLSMLCSTLLAAPFSASVSVLFSSPEKNDFIMSDLFAQVADARPVRILEDRIVIVDIGHSGREEIASTLEILALSGPRAVGLDVNFALPGDEETDRYLMDCISSMPQLVLPLSVNPAGEVKEGADSFAIDDRPFFFGSREMGPLSYGVINLPSIRAKNSIREYATAFPIAGGLPEESFPCAVARMGGSPMAAEVAARGNRLEKISYPSREFVVIPWDEVLYRTADIEDKYVLVGAVNEASDMHATPINSYMAGIMIHAYALATILDGKFYTTLPDWVDWTLAALLCFLLVWMSIGLTTKTKGLVLRVFQIFFVYVAVRTGYWLYIDHNVIFNFSYTFLMLAFGLFAADVWNGLDGLWEIVRDRAVIPLRRYFGRPARPSGQSI